jgi:hypothetical protein
MIPIPWRMIARVLEAVDCMLELLFLMRAGRFWDEPPVALG